LPTGHRSARRQRGDAKGEVEVRALDLADLANVKAFAEAEAASGERLDLLVLNAGIMACPLT
jgi:NAD(P)-dependent dehydrogenase (short-subunit alcohol dehydrogenase family)